MKIKLAEDLRLAQDPSLTCSLQARDRLLWEALMPSPKSLILLALPCRSPVL